MHYYLAKLPLLLILLLAPTVWAKEHLQILAWDGYADADLVREFEKRYQVDVKVTLVYSDDELWSKVTEPNSDSYDLIAVNTAELQRYIAKGLVRSLDTNTIPNLNHQLPRFKHREAIPGLVKSGQTYAIPYTYSEMGIIYNRKLVHQPPESINALWDPTYAGKVLAFNTSNHNFTLAALGSGIKNPFIQSPEQLRQSARRLVELRRNLLTFYSSPQEAVKLFKTQEIALIFANYGNQQLKALIDVGADVGYTMPQDGTLAWLDCWAALNEAGPLAEQWINFMLEEKASLRLTNAQGLANTIQESTAHHNANLIWLEPIENADARASLWDQIISGDVMERF
ncbi:MAG: extracellular solute-binding protein [Cellvibrio sp.]|uniref:extracellular solute-binding protein n=1 Tax=Cellvibrio sp. TaxID=1965322 RepID=UPI0031B2A6CC